MQGENLVVSCSDDCQSQSTQIPNWRCCMATHSLKSKTEKSKATKKLRWSIFCNKGDV
jgi:hypothetical protein